MQNRKLQLVAYIATPTEKIDARVLSDQLALIQAYCDEYGYSITEVFGDVQKGDLRGFYDAGRRGMAFDGLIAAYRRVFRSAYKLEGQIALFRERGKHLIIVAEESKFGPQIHY